MRAEELKEGEALLVGVALAERERKAGEGVAVLLAWAEVLGEGLLSELWEGEGVRLGEPVPLPVSELPPPPPPLPGEAEAVWVAPLPLALPVGLCTGLALPWLAVALALPVSLGLCEAAASVIVGEGVASTVPLWAALALAQEEAEGCCWEMLGVREGVKEELAEGLAVPVLLKLLEEEGCTEEVGEGVRLAVL